MGPVDFKNTVYAGQKDLLTLLENTPGRRKEWFQKALGIDYLSTGSQKILKERADTKTGELQRMEGELAALAGRQGEVDPAVLQASAESFCAALADIQKLHDSLAEKKKGIEDELRRFDAEKTGHTRLVERQVSLARETEGLVYQRDLVKSKLIDLARQEQEFRALQEKAAVIAPKREALALLRKQKSEADRLRAEIRFAGQRCDELRSRIAALQVKRAELAGAAAQQDSLTGKVRKVLALGPEITYETLEHTVARLDERIQHTSGTLAAREHQLAAERTKVLADYETIRTAGPDGTCPLCRQKLGDHFKEIGQEFEKRLAEIDKEAVKVCGEQERNAAEKKQTASARPLLLEIRKLIARLAARPDIEADLAGQNADLAARTQELNGRRAELQALHFDENAWVQAENEILELDKTEKRYNDLREKIAEGTGLRLQVTELEARIAERKEELAHVQEAIARSPFDAKKGAALEESRAATDGALRAADAEAARTTERLRHAEEKIAEYRKGEEELRRIGQRVAALKDEIELLKMTRSLIAEYVIYLMQVVRSRIEGEVGRIISEITGGRYEQVLLDDDFNLFIRDVDDDYPIERFSGGEQDDIAVALRISLSRYLAGLHNVHESTFLIFDEIFGSQDEERRTNLLTTLRTQESRFPQIILISHIPEMQGEFTNTLVVEMGTDQSSRVKEMA
jgi:DNA repair exonuclease SbcCD ATPase subunit